MKKKILIFANSSWYLKNFKFDFIKDLKKNYNILLILSDIKYKNFFDFHKIEYIVLKNFDAESKNIFKEIYTILSLYFIYKNFKPDLAIHYTIKPNIYGTIIANLLSIKCLSNITGLGNIFINKTILNTIIQKFYFFTQKYASSIIFQNQKDLNFFKTFSKIHNYNIIESSGVDTNLFSSIKKESDKNICFLMISRIIKEKGINEYIESAKIITELKYKKHNNISFNLIGPNNNDYLSKKVISYSKLNYIKYIGEVDNIKDFIEKASCIVLPSYREGSSKVLIEGASMGKPLLASNVPGCNNIVIDELNGYLFAPKDINSLVETILKFINTKKEKKYQMGKLSRKLAKEKFDINKINLLQIKIIEQII